MANWLDLTVLACTVLDMANRTTDTDAEYITPAEAERIAFLSTKQISRLADAGRIDFIRPGKHRRYRRSDVEALVAPTSSPVRDAPAGVVGGGVSSFAEERAS